MSLRLNVSGVTKDYTGNRVLRDCSFSFDRSGIYTLMGQNGCGKSTLLRICALIEKPDSGEITYFSEEAAMPKDIPLMRRITLVLPRVGVFNATTFGNVAYGLKIRGMKRHEIEERVGRVLEFVGLQDRRRQNAITLSSGETQRLGIARALVIEPEILFLDEPTASVDQKNTGIIEEIILKMKEEGRTMVIVTTHDRSQAEKLADFRLLMEEGKVVVETSRPS